MTKKGALYVVATPVGNLQDITLRALDVLREVDWVAAEDTRHSRKLLNHFGIQAQYLSLHQHNEQAQAKHIVDYLSEGAKVALISDAGTPAISDPGYLLVRAVTDAGFDVLPIPGASSLVTALSVAGLPADKFVFHGFLPSKATQREAVLKSLVHEIHTLVFFEAPHRILALLTAIDTIFGADRELMVGREMCKFFESYYRGSAAEIQQHLSDHSDEMCGEFVVCLSGASEKASDETVELDPLLNALLAELPLSKAVKLATKISGYKRNIVYERALNMRQDDEDDI